MGQVKRIDHMVACEGDALGPFPKLPPKPSKGMWYESKILDDVIQYEWGRSVASVFAHATSDEDILASLSTSAYIDKIKDDVFEGTSVVGHKTSDDVTIVVTAAFSPIAAKQFIHFITHLIFVNSPENKLILHGRSRKEANPEGGQPTDGKEMFRMQKEIKSDFLALFPKAEVALSVSSAYRKAYAYPKGSRVAIVAVPLSGKTDTFNKLEQLFSDKIQLDTAISSDPSDSVQPPTPEISIDKSSNSDEGEKVKKTVYVHSSSFRALSVGKTVQVLVATANYEPGPVTIRVDKAKSSHMKGEIKQITGVGTQKELSDIKDIRMSEAGIKKFWETKKVGAVLLIEGKPTKKKEKDTSK